MHKRACISLLSISLLAACGGGLHGDDGKPGQPGQSGAAGANGLNALVAVSAEAAGAHCAAGGSRIDAGLDANANGTLDPSEVASTQYVCGGTVGTGGVAGSAGAPGTNGLTTLMQMADEPAGTNCASGGNAVHAGLDVNGNGALDAGEVASTGYVCNGAAGANGSNGSNGANGSNGSNGADGSNGFDSLVSVVAEAPGANCATGGSKVSTGVDSNGNRVLDAGEVNATSYICNGAQGASFTWQSVSGNSVQAVRNTGYLASSDASTVAVNLPTEANGLQVGDIVRVTGAGLGGWRITQNDGQFVDTKNIGDIPGRNWTLRLTLGATTSCFSIAASANGTTLVASCGLPYVSTDAGATWSSRNAMNASWTGVASSYDGSVLVAGTSVGPIYTSINGGDWTAQQSGTAAWTSVASSASGERLAAASLGGNLWTWRMGDANWTARESARQWLRIKSSADGNYLVAATSSPGQKIYTSANGGVDWTPVGPDATWHSVASSADGQRLAAVTSGGAVYTSVDAGLHWNLGTTIGSASLFQFLATSADGQKIFVGHSQQLWTSMDGGATWSSPRNVPVSFLDIALSADQGTLAAVSLNGVVYTSTASTTIGTAGAISGGQFDTISLQYLGNNRFTVIAHEGSLKAQ